MKSLTVQTRGTTRNRMGILSGGTKATIILLITPNTDWSQVSRTTLGKIEKRAEAEEEDLKEGKERAEEGKKRGGTMVIYFSFSSFFLFLLFVKVLGKMPVGRVTSQIAFPF